MKNKLSIFLGVIQAFVAIGAIPAGFSMIFNSDGTELGMTIDFLQSSPFNDFFVPGLLLFIVNGLFNLVASILSFTRNKYSGILGLILGISLILWIVIQIYFITLFSFMQPMFFFIGIIEIIISLLIIKQSN